MTQAQSKKEQINFNKLRKRLRRETGRAIADYNMIEEGDKIMVCLSGGKDSYTMLAILKDLQRSAPVNFELIAVNLDQKQPGFPEHILPEYLKSIDQPFHIIERDTYSVVMDTVQEGKTTCGICSRLRRSTLYAFANKIGITKIALGHHRDDIIETLFLNLFNGGKLKAMPPKLRSDNGQNILIRPLAYCKEKDIKKYSEAQGFPIIPCNLCGSQESLQRQNIKAMIKDWDKQYPGRSDVIFKSIQNVAPSQLADGQLFDFKSLKTNNIAVEIQQNHALSPLSNIKVTSWLPQDDNAEVDESAEIKEDWSPSTKQEMSSEKGKVQVFEP
ncbi:MAG: tRNA 2-thiocytidine(32) synthetase TtcA [Saccharospirillaceae bacterium]|nr:tRNA 2-thiocytidine(32) synthetase TtcA [Pseudomonadales bacterium]NRB80896.1 tRNA 2-thiocytidine(32) synthetase TtcA [Saccharospirillaceae bacterium]